MFQLGHMNKISKEYQAFDSLWFLYYLNKWEEDSLIKIKLEGANFLFKSCYCKTGNFRVQENFANFVISGRFAKISCTRILPAYSRALKLSLSSGPLEIGNLRDFPVAKLPTSRFCEIFLSWKFPVLQYLNCLRPPTTPFSAILSY